MRSTLFKRIGRQMCNFLEYFLMGKLELHFPSNINNFWTIYDAYKFASDIFLSFQTWRLMSKQALSLNVIDYKIGHRYEKN